MDQTLPFKLFATCIPVKGNQRSTICDLQRNRVHLIPNSLYELLQETLGQSLMQIKSIYGNEHDETIDEYFTFLEKEELIFYTNHPEKFPPISLDYVSNSQISNAILDIDQNSCYDVVEVIRQLDLLNCKYLEIRSYSPRKPLFFARILEAAKTSTVISIGIINAFEQGITENEWLDLCEAHKRVTSIFIHNSPDEKELSSPNLLTPICYITKAITSEKCCGQIDQGRFISYTETFSEFKHFNSCLNEKISIDSCGLIKNCPSMNENFGNVNDTALAGVLENSDFKRRWNITKDQISICKDCEFRYVCTDCRAYLDDPENEMSKPLKCGYNPNSCTWEEWSTNPLKKEAIGYYRIQV